MRTSQANRCLCRVVALVAVVLGGLAAAPASVAAAPPPKLSEFCTTGSGAGNCRNAGGIAVNPSSGHVYVADWANNRINEFDVWGQFIRTWGWGVVASGPDNNPRNERQEITVDATAGNFRFSFNDEVKGGEASAPIAFNATSAAVQDTLEGIALLGPGAVEVTGPNGGPWTVEFVGSRADEDEPPLEVKDSTLSGGTSSVTVKTTQSGANFEICTVASGDVCRAGQGGQNQAQKDGVATGSPGQLWTPEGITVDSVGNVWVADTGNLRVQKFDPTGHFLLMIGRGVDQGPLHPGNLCTAIFISEGDMCGTGSAGNGSSEFDFKVPFSNRGGNFIGIGPGDKVNVGDQGRIQQFNADGSLAATLALPGEVVQSLAVSPTGEIYVSFVNLNGDFKHMSKENVLKLGPTGEELCSLKVADPTAIAVDVDGSVYVTDGVQSSTTELEVRKFTPGCVEVPDFAFQDSLRGSRGIATLSSPTCGLGSTDLYVWSTRGFVRFYGTPPDPGVCPPPKVPPSIGASYAVSVASDGATVHASINPHFWPDTRYFVQYGTGKCSEGGCTQQQPLGAGSLVPGGVLDDDVNTGGVFLSGLTPDTTYHFRYVATSSGGGPVRGVGGTLGQDGEEGTFRTFPLRPRSKENCPNQAFRTGASASLPNCRAYEMVSPIDKNNGDIDGEREAALNVSSADGNRASFSSKRAFADAIAGPLSNQYLAERDPAVGWKTHSISPPREVPALYNQESLEILFKGFTEDLCSAWVLQDSNIALAPGAPSGFPNLYRRRNCIDPGYELITRVPPPGFNPAAESSSKYWPEIEGLSTDGSRSVFRANASLTPKACPEARFSQIYESLSSGELRLVSALPNGSGVCVHASVGTNQFGGTGFRGNTVYRAVSSDASRIFWTAGGVESSKGPEGGISAERGTLYLRINAGEEQSKVSAGKCTEPSKACTYRVSEQISTKPAQFWTASEDGSKAFFSIEDDLYEFEAEIEGSTLATSATLIAKHVNGVVGASADASHVYLLSTDVLSGEELNSQGDKAQAGKPNLYLYAEGDFTFVATLAPNEARAGGEEEGITYSQPSVNNVQPRYRVSRVSEDGLHMVFVSGEALTSYVNLDANSGKPSGEVYLYDAPASGTSGNLACISCNPTGARPRGRLIVDSANQQRWFAALIPGWTYQLRPSRSLSTDGSQLFFQSFESLVPRDTNGAADVYEWDRAADLQACEAQIGGELFVPASGGCLSLVSSGENPQDTEFVDASADGSDVFIATSASLLPQDPGLVDIYDARVNGGFPPPPSPPAACEGEACRGPLSPPNDPTPASSSFEGAGNMHGRQPKPRCRKGKERRKGRCVSRSKRHDAKARRKQRKRVGHRAVRNRNGGVK